MTYLLDTNVISEIGKGAKYDPRVAAWYGALADDDLYLSTLVLGEIRKGAEMARGRTPGKAAALDAWLAEVKQAFAGRILSIDEEVADIWGRIAAMRAVPAIDALLAATAKAHGLVLVTRNEADMRELGAAVLNPFKGPGRL